MLVILLTENIIHSFLMFFNSLCCDLVPFSGFVILKTAGLLGLGVGDNIEVSISALKKLIG